MTTTALPDKRRVLMADPEYFEVKYAINPFMKDGAGVLKKVDKAKAREQWEALRETYRTLGYEVVVLDARPNLPDMVFAANQSFPFWITKENRPGVILASMASPYRRAEVPFFGDWYAEHGYRVFTLPDENITFEGNGDVLVQNTLPVIWAASGPRTNAKVVKYLEEITGYQVHSLTLRHADFYHLDTCFSILNDTTVAVYPSAFDAEDLRKIAKGFATVIEIDFEESHFAFAGNCHSPDGKTVIMQPGAERFKVALEGLGFTVIEIDTSEFMKSGGSVFCLKMMAY